MPKLEPELMRLVGNAKSLSIAGDLHSKVHLASAARASEISGGCSS